MSSLISGGVNTINILRWILIFSTGIYVFPIIIYISLYRKLGVLFDIAFGSLLFLFYGPAYLNILNIYALCRIDDISWGTKGLDADSSRNSPWKNSWRLIKFICVGKYLLWNIGIGLLLINVGDEYETRFFKSKMYNKLAKIKIFDIKKYNFSQLVPYYYLEKKVLKLNKIN